MKQITLLDEWKLFLERVNLDEKTMPPDQIREMKRAFMGGVSSVLVIMNRQLPDDEGEAVLLIEDLWQQCLTYWKKETEGNN